MENPRAHSDDFLLVIGRAWTLGLRFPQLSSTLGALTGFPYIPVSATAAPHTGASTTLASSPTCPSLIPGVALPPQLCLSGTPGESASWDGRVLSLQRSRKDQVGPGLPIQIQGMFSPRHNVFKGVCVVY